MFKKFSEDQNPQQSSQKDNIYTQIPMYFIDFLCIHREHLPLKKTRELFQTHEYNQRIKNSNIVGSLIKREIDLLEGMSRKRYSGPVGWVDARGDGEIGIALRCGEIAADEKSIRIFAGCGIVAGSNPDEELAESQAKLNPMRTALETLA